MSTYCHLSPADREDLVQVLRKTLPSPFEVIASAKRRSIIRAGALARAGFGIYFLFNSGRLFYIGQSVQIARRLWTHSKKWRFDEVAIVATPQLEHPMNRAWMDVAEAFYIELLDPTMNDRHIG